MAVKIELKRSSVPGKVPTTSSLDLGELALNTYDGRAFLKQQQGGVETIVEFATTAGSGSTVASASFATTASYALTASFAQNFNPNATASYALFALTASYVESGVTASFAVSSSYAATADYAFNSAPGPTLVTGSVTASVNLSNNIFLIKSGSSTLFSLDNNGTATISGSASNLFLIKNASNKTVLAVSQSGVIVLSTQSAQPTGTAPNGGIYFTSTALFIGVD
jgi:hypothetical protein